MDVPLGWQTDLAVLDLHGSEIEDRGDHVVVRSPDNPTFYWGNFVLARERLEEPGHWLRVFEDAFPDSEHRSIGLAAIPEDVEVWARHGLRVELDDVLASDRCPEPLPVPDGYRSARLESEDDWARSTDLRIAEFAEGVRIEIDYERRSTVDRRIAGETGREAWFGAFAGDELAAELGIVDCGGGLARYQSVVTAADHRRRGLAGHLLGVAAQWARARGCDRWVIAALAGSDAARLYQARGFRPADNGARAGRKPY